MDGVFRFALVNDRTVQALRLIEVVERNPWLPGGYFILGVSVLAFCRWRRHSPWGAWLFCGLFGVPALVYSRACFYIFCKVLTL